MSPWDCLPCRSGRCDLCDRLRGCEHIGTVVDGRLVLCAALTKED